VAVLVISAAAGDGVHAWSPGCAAMEPWLKPAAAATTQASNGPVGEAGSR
jgi:hypothetical protein